MLGIKHPVISAGMYIAGGPELVAAVSNAGGLGVIGGLYFTPDDLATTIREVKRDYTEGKLDELIDIVACSGAKLFVSAVGVAPTDVVDKLHANGIFYMNLAGHPKHVTKACAAGADIICAQGSEAGGHAGEIPTSVLVPACVDLVTKYKSPLTGQPVQLVAAGGICDGRGVAASFMYGASAVWIGTRFVTAKESSAPEESKQVNELEDLLNKGIIPLDHEIKTIRGSGVLSKEIIKQSAMRPMSIACGLINNGQQSAADIIAEMVAEAVQCLRGASSVVVKSDYLD
ncbi:hypothetical protein FE257_000906 [Aspergillus nanangensis]|uniref:Nitronate monooxygenase domain-containing protein n=1 Tax=Aspergillus nanangensis TaxID=2582783 RepID=A0AAD4CE99_ASPNN|nr:hypothetical protein FE257_000906 [Aspergillus nanangensis]